MGNADSDRRKCDVSRDAAKQDSNWQDNRISCEAIPMGWQQGETKPQMGGDINGHASGLDYAELSVSCDNRTDELRLLGNGVVPATAALAFRTLLQELTQ